MSISGHPAMGPHKALKNFLRPSLRITPILFAAVVVCCVCTATSFVAKMWWVFELTTHFRVQYALVLASAAMVFALLRRFGAAVVSLAFAFPNLVLLASLYVGSPTHASVGAPLKILYMNLSVTNQEYGKAVQCVRSQEPDFFAVSELSKVWLSRLRTALPEYPYVISRTRRDQFGIGLFSKKPLENPTILDLGTLGFPAIRAVVPTP